MGIRPTDEQWRAMQEFFKQHPELRIRRGQQWAVGVNRYFIHYKQSCDQGERWGTKEQLATHRKASARSVKAYKKRKRETDPEYRAKHAERLIKLIDRWAAIDEASKEEKERRQKIAKDRRFSIGNWASKPLPAYVPKPKRKNKAERRKEAAERFAKRFPEKVAALKARGKV